LVSVGGMWPAVPAFALIHIALEGVAASHKKGPDKNIGAMSPLTI
jgi:hypothetical protein